MSSEAFNRFQQILGAAGAIATIERSVGADSSVLYARTGHTPEQDDRRVLVPSIAVRPSDFRQLERLADRASGAVVRANVEVVEEPGGSQVGFNVLADHVGTDPSAASVMIGAHFDSIHVAQGATDNAAGCAIVIEAMRALVAANARPTRTTRLALWGGEEQGRRGSKAYVQAHQRALPAAYFNLDHGAGRAIELIIEGNNPLARQAERWAWRLAGDGLLSAVTLRTAGSDHITFRDAGVPTFAFRQDSRTYARTHHSTADTISEVREADLRQASLIVALAAYLAAQ